MNRWTSIGGFHNVRKVQKDYPNLFSGPITYRGKVKLHGTCGSVAVYPDGRVEGFSRTNKLNEREDNANFYKQCVLANEEFWSGIADDEVITVYGEWCGPGIMKGTAINQIPNKVFAIFAIQVGDNVPDEFEFDHAPLDIDPGVIKSILGDLPDNVVVLPWQGTEITVEYGNTESMKVAVAELNRAVDNIEGCDPWVKHVFGIDGMGEGVVYYPINFMRDSCIDRHEMSTFSFKAKGEKHKTVAHKQPVQVDPEVAASIDGFVKMVVTPARLEQGAREVAGGELEFNQRYIGSFIKWMGQDVQKETADELEASGLNWKQVAKSVSTEARSWYMEKFEEL